MNTKENTQKIHSKTANFPIKEKDFKSGEYYITINLTNHSYTVTRQLTYRKFLLIINNLFYEEDYLLADQCSRISLRKTDHQDTVGDVIYIVDYQPSATYDGGFILRVSTTNYI